MIKLVRYIYQKVIVSSRVNKLPVVQAAVDSEGHAFVTLLDGLTFFGPKPHKKERKFYNLLLGSRIKRSIPFECYQIAIDIVIRYKEGNLKWGGPPKEAFYKVQGGDYIAEMGAFRGYYTMYLSQKVGPQGKIIAIEPIPSNLEYLRKNIEFNKLDNVFIVPKGVWNTNDKKVFQRKSTDYQSGSIDIAYQNQESLAIEVNTLDKILTDHKLKDLDFMLIQLNGAECEALEGLTLVKPKNLSIAARYNKDNRNIAGEIIETLKQRGYSVETLNEKFIYARLN